jgi:hypothetical protein
VFKEQRTHAIPLTVRTRSYGRPDGKLQTGLGIELDVQTWASELVVEFKTGRVEDTHSVTSYAPDRTHWLKPANRADFDGVNAAGDFMDPDREDYSVQFGPDGTSELEFTDDGLCLDLHQEVRLRALLAGPARWSTGQLVLSNSAGRIRIVGIHLSSDPAEARTGKN